MKLAVFLALGFLLAVLLLGWLMTCLRYRVGSRHVKISLFGLCLRRIPLEDIASVSKRRCSGFAENWSNTVRPSHRLLVLRRRRGWPRNVVITPKNRYVFKTEVEKALARIASEGEPQSAPPGVSTSQPE